MAHAIRSANIAKAFAISPSLQRLCDLETRELRLSTKSHSPGLRPSSAFAGPRKDHAPFKFSEGSKHRKDQFPMRRGGINHRVSNGPEACSSLRDHRQDVQEVPGGAG